MVIEAELSIPGLEMCALVLAACTIYCQVEMLGLGIWLSW